MLAKDLDGLRFRAPASCDETIREVALPLGLFDTNVCAIDEVGSGLKLVIRNELR